MAELQGTGGTIMRSSFEETKEVALRAALAAPKPTCEQRPQRNRQVGAHRGIEE